METNNSSPPGKLRPSLHNYTLRKCIGHSDSMALWRGVSKRTGEGVAIKVFDKSSITRVGEAISLLTELKILLGIRHRNIINTLDAVETHSTVNIILELGKQDLHSMILTEGSISENTAKKLALDISQGLLVLHSHGILHRDIKPENILVFKEPDSSEPLFKLADFGLASTRWHGALQTVASGTPGYAAPEVALALAPETTKADAWSLGRTLLAALTGEAPKGSLGERELEAVRDDFFPIRNDLICSKDCVDVLKGLLCTKPTERMSIRSLIRSKWLKGIPQIPEFDNTTTMKLRVPKAFLPTVIPRRADRMSLDIPKRLSHSVKPGKQTNKVSQSTEAFCQELDKYQMCCCSPRDLSGVPVLDKRVEDLSMKLITSATPIEVADMLETMLSKSFKRVGFVFKSCGETKPAISITVTALKTAPHVTYPVLDAHVDPAVDGELKTVRDVSAIVERAIEVVDKKWDDIHS